MVNGQGIVKVADLGLVKKRGKADVTHPSKLLPTPKLDHAQSANATGFDMSMGTPAYMAPEQARDATTVDARADVYSLGCTLYDLLTGRPPFTGRTAAEVITAHASEPVVAPDRLVKTVPPELSAVLLKMVAKAPDDRYRDMGQCITALEEFLGVSTGTGPFAPSEEHAAVLALAGRVFRDAPLAKARRLAPPAFLGLCGVAAAAAALVRPTLADRVAGVGAVAGLAAFTVASYLVLAGLIRRDVVLAKAHQFAFGAGPLDWLKVLAVTAAVGGLLVVLGLVWTWVIVALVAIGLATATVYGLDLPRDHQRKPHLNKINGMLRTMRLRGLDEEALRQFVCRYTGDHWEEPYEALFGYDAKIAARRRWANSLRGQPRPRFAPWRDGFAAWVDGRVKRRQRARDRRALRLAEERRFRAEGFDPEQSKARAKRQAAALLDQADQLRQTIDKTRAEQDRRAASPGKAAAPLATPGDPAAPTAAPGGPVTVNVNIAPGGLFDSATRGTDLTAAAAAAVHKPGHGAAKSLPGYVRTSHLERRYGGPLGLLFGPTTRLPIAIALLAAFGLWFHQTHPDFPANAGRAVVQVHDSLAGNHAAAEAVAQPADPAPDPNAEINLPLLAPAVRHALSGYPPGLAGGLLLVSCVTRSGRVGLINLLGAAVILAGDHVLPAVSVLTPQRMAAVLGTAVCLVGGWFAQDP